MYTARQKKRDNVAEYVLYMWQVEDLIRANGCDMDRIKANVISGYSLAKSEIQEVTDWWENLVEMMKLEQKEAKGHLQFIVNTINELNTLHGRLLQSPAHISYHVRFQQIESFLRELEGVTNPKPSNDIELMLGALYNVFLLKLQGREISIGTLNAVQEFGKFLALLAQKYREDQQGKLDMEI
ncbi:DUF4924 family protein [Alkaliflexus imshenetskii]|uniref:DUF4924 family protein n=1 Tax=Alkaliflexus imshenetskii TaxID=286730 RepID=UPI00047AC9E9|nr:DUF4924 family protein [Alkaliflexus imshenetskii]